MVNENESSIERLRQRLYKKGASFDIRLKRKSDGGGEEEKSTYWGEEKQNGFEKKKFAIVKILIILAVVSFVIASGVGAYFYFGGLNVISGRNIKIDIEGASYGEGGKAVNLNIFVENKNDSQLELADLIVEYPAGTISPEDFNLKSSRERFSLGTIMPNQRVNKLLNFILVGEKDEEKKINIIIEYRLGGSNAIFAKNQEYTIKILSSPVSISITAPSEIKSNEKFETEIEIVSNAEVILKNLIMKAEYPPAFDFVGANPSPIDDNNKWMIGDLEPFQKKTVKITGIARGLDMSEKAIHASVGAEKLDGFVVYGRGLSAFTIRKSQLATTLLLDGIDNSKNIYEAGDAIRGKLIWRNNLPVKIYDAVVEIRVEGNSVDKKSINVLGGSYKFSNNTLVWSPSTVSGLKSIVPGDDGSVEFNFSVLKSIPVNNIGDKNFTIKIIAEIKGKTASEDGGVEEITNIVEKEIKISSDVQLAARALHYIGSFDNAGPMPPIAGKETTYTIVWSISNPYNDISSVVVRSVLPAYVRWINNISPSDAKIAFNETTGEIVWQIGKINSGSGNLRPATEVSFQVGLTPSASQAGASPVLLFESKLNAHDDFSGVDLNITKQQLNTMLNNDPNFNREEGVVKQ